MRYLFFNPVKSKNVIPLSELPYKYKAKTINQSTGVTTLFKNNFNS